MNIDSELLHIDKVLKEKIDVKMKHDEFVCQKEFKKKMEVVDQIDFVV